jgi:cAMP-dependent protein kinase regulator/CRP/FNR family cyclic AMP-dependent transcriptional regulator/cGMP-dependent protein kinase 2
MPVSAERLQAVPLFSTLSGDDLDVLGGRFEEREVKSGTHLTSEGASGYTFFVIENGTVEVARDGRVVNTLGPGDFFGETAIVSGERRNATVTATSDVELLALFGTEFRILERDWPGVAERIAETIAQRTAALAPQTD